MLTLQEIKILHVSIQKLTTEGHGPTHWLKERKLCKKPSSFWGLPMQPSCAQPEGAGRQVLVSPPGVGPFPVTTPPCIRKKESSPLPTWEKPFRPSDPALPPQTDFSLHTSCTWPEPQDRGRFTDADCPQNSQYTVSATTQSLTITGNTWRSLCPKGWHDIQNWSLGRALLLKLDHWDTTGLCWLQLRKARTDVDAGF